MNVAMAMLVCECGMCPKTCRRSNIMYGDQHMINTNTIVSVIFTVLTLARGMMPRELARRVAAAPKPARSSQKPHMSKREQPWISPPTCRHEYRAFGPYGLHNNCIAGGYYQGGHRKQCGRDKTHINLPGHWRAQLNPTLRMALYQLLLIKHQYG